ncbi:MAG: M23 family metallopeptidase, partial [Bacteroidales bacterium]|nr:M23 family metallopeptidase [Bacteroidales bacterium]
MKRWIDLAVMLLLSAGTILAVMLVPMESPISRVPAEYSGPVEIEQIQPEPAKTLYGIPVSSYHIVSKKVRRGESLAELLYPHNITTQQIYRISLLHDTLIDERKIKPGNIYTVFSNNDTIPAYFVYEKDPLNYVVIGMESDSVWAWNEAKPIQQKVQFASGTIESSLWESMREIDANPMLAVELSEIFAWSIDFFGVQEGDRYKVIYEESYVDSQSIGINSILGAWFYHNGTDFWGIPFEQEGVRSFFDEKGNSLRKAFLKAPLRFSRISSRFSHSRYHPVLKIRRPHHGVDYVAPVGTPVYSVGDGVVTGVGYQKRGGGNYVKIKHNSVYTTTYMHLSRFGKGIRQGVYVKQGDVIGYVGSTGLSTGPHLDFRFYKNGSAVNPLKVEAPPVEPVYEENLA